MTGPTLLTTPSHGSGKQIRIMRWAGMALPLGACLTIWILGPDAAEVAWLRTVHQAIGLAVLIWTALRLARRPGRLKPRMMVTTTKEWLLTIRLSLVMLYALLILQPLLALSGRMLEGESIVVWGMAIPSVLAVNEPLAREVAWAHGWNAALLLALIGVHVVMELHDRPKAARLPSGWARRLPSFKCPANGSR